MALSTRRGSGRSRARFTLILLILTSITLLTLDFRGFSPLDSARSAVLDAFEPVGDFASDTFEPVSDAWNGAFDYDRVERENEQLREQVDQLEGQITSGDVAKQSLQQLLEQVDIPFVGDLPTVGARVVSGAVANFDTTIEIDKGESDGVRRGMAVVTGRGLVGRVVNTSSDRAVVDLLSGGNIAVAFSVVGTNVLGIARGTGDGARLSATVDVDRLVFPGQILVTSGTEGSTYPQGLPIGTVTDVRGDRSSLEQELTAEMLADLSDLTFVSIVLWEPVAQ
jgi:rod shape-determining protein MreC